MPQTMLNDNDLNTIIYNSKNYDYQTEIRVKVLAFPKKGSDELKTLRTKTFYPQTIRVYNHEQYLQIDAEFNDNATEEGKTAAAMYRAFFTHDFAEIENDNYVWTSVEIAPNPASPELFLKIETTENVIFLGQQAKQLDMISFCSPATNSHVQADDRTLPSLLLDKMVNYGIIDDNEKEMIHNMVEKHNSVPILHMKSNKAKEIFKSIFSSSPAQKKAQKNAHLIESLHMTEQEKQIFDPDMLNISDGIENGEDALNSLIGLENVKEEIKKLKAKLSYRKRQKERFIFVDNAASMHMCFTGSPGTGKTTVARIITGILYDMGYIKENKCVEINGQNLKGGYTGQTAIITKLVLKSAKNKVLFIDEAYALFDGYENGFGKEAVAVILKQMEDERDNTIVIFAGYKDDMEEFLRMNDGLKSRINRYIDFENYNIEELTSIMFSQLRSKKLYITEEALAKCILAFKKAETSERFSNGRFVRNMIEKIEYEHAYNTHKVKDVQRQDTIEAEDVPDSVIKELLTHSM